jgi:hypothetical protein
MNWYAHMRKVLRSHRKHFLETTFAAVTHPCMMRRRVLPTAFSHANLPLDLFDYSFPHPDLLPCDEAP